MRKISLIVTLGCMLAGGVAFGQPAAMKGQMQMGRHPMLFSELKLSDQQKTDMKKVWFDLRQKQIDVRAKIDHARLDYEKLASADNPDQNALSAKIQDIANLRVQLQKNKLDAWFSANKLLTPEQQKIWKKVLQHPMMFERAGRMNMMRERGGMMNHMEMMGRPGMMQRNFRGNGMGPMTRPPNPAPPDSAN
jgi:Spy/CpxP family protein refolding chaperone